MREQGSSRRVLAVVLLTALVALSGCGRIGAMSRVDPLSIAVYPGGQGFGEAVPQGPCPLVASAGSYSYGAVNLDCFVFPEDRPRPGITPTATEGQLAYRRAAAATGQTERNRLTALLLKHSDDICVEEMGRLTGNEATVNASLNILGTGATTAANIVSGELAQGILAGVGTFTGASRSHIRADIYRNTFSYAVSRAIDRERERLRGIIEGRYGQPTTQFTVDDAIRAANEYHGVCSFFRGLGLVLASVEGDQRSRDAQMRSAQIDDLERQLIRLRSRLVGASQGEQATLTEDINEINDRIQALVLAGVPVPPPEDQNSDQNQNQNQGQNLNQGPNQNPGQNSSGPGEAGTPTPS